MVQRQRQLLPRNTGKILQKKNLDLFFTSTSSRNNFLTSTPLSEAGVSKENRKQGEVDDDDTNLALAISMSEEVERRQNDNFITTQEYVEDENRRSLLIDSQEDMFAETDSGIEKNLGTGSKSDDDEDFVNTADETMKKRWLGEEGELLMPETRSCFVGQRPAPSVVVRLQNDSVNDDSRAMKSFTSRMATSNSAPAQSFLVAVELMKAGINKNSLLKKKLSLPLKLQFIGQRVEEDETVVIELSDGTNYEEFFMCEKYSFMYRLNKMPMNSIMTVTGMDVSNHRGKVIKSVKVEKWNNGKIGNPVKL